MNFFLKILNEVRSQPYLKVDGASGLRYLFKWDGALRAYTYRPKKQDEVDDMFNTMGRYTAYIFAPVNIATTAEVVPLLSPVAPVTPESTKATLDEKLIEAALLRGVVVTEDDTNEIVTRLSQAYDRGATDTLNAQSASKRKIRRETVEA